MAKVVDLTHSHFSQTLINDILNISLVESGYKISKLGVYIIAEKSGKKYLILRTGQYRRNLHYVVSSVVGVQNDRISKLKKIAEENNAIPTLAIGAFIDSYLTMELIVAPLSLWESKEKPKCLSIAKSGYYFNYKHSIESDYSNMLVHLGNCITLDDTCGNMVSRY